MRSKMLMISNDDNGQRLDHVLNGAALHGMDKSERRRGARQPAGKRHASAKPALSGVQKSSQEAMGDGRRRRWRIGELLGREQRHQFVGPSGIYSASVSTALRGRQSILAFICFTADHCLLLSMQSKQTFGEQDDYCSCSAVLQVSCALHGTYQGLWISGSRSNPSMQLARYIVRLQ